MKKTNNFKKRLLLIGGTVASLTIPLVLTSCSDSLNEVISNSILSNNGTNFSNNLSLKDVVTKTLNNNSSQTEIMDRAASKMALDWFRRLSTTGNATFRNLYNDQVKKVNDEYDDKLDQYKKDYPNSWSARFQQDVLDPNGGTESSYKETQMLGWAKTEIQSRLFEKSYLTLIDNKTGNATQNVTGAQLLDILLNDNGTPGTSNSTGYSFGFASKLSQSIIDTIADKEYSKFQKFVYDQWIQFSNPYVINMSLWKYTTPDGGINSVYSAAPQSSSSSDSSDGSSDSSTSTSSLKQVSTREGEDGSGGSSSGSGSTTTSTSGSYTFPYFKSDNDIDNQPDTTIGKFKAFVNASKVDSNFKEKTTGTSSSSSSSNASTLGLKKIPKIYTDDSSTYILAKNSSIFNDLYIEFAAGSSYLYSMVGNGATTGSASSATKEAAINTSIGKKLDMPTNNGNGQNNIDNPLDLITRQFVSKTSFNSASNGVITKLDSATTTKFNEAHLSKELVNELINSNGELSSLRNNDLYSIDSFMISDTDLNEYMLLRNQAGVHAISIDGWDYIKKATTKEEARKKAGNVVLYRYFQNQLNIDSDVTITDINNELSTFFKDNFSYLIYAYSNKSFNELSANNAKSTSLKIATSTSNTKEESSNNNFDSDENKQGLFDVDSITTDGNLKNLLTSLNIYLFDLSKYTFADDYNKKMLEAKITYSKNYGANAKTNGLASPWVYSTTDSSSSNYYFDVANVSSLVSNPYEKIVTSSQPTNFIEENANAQSVYDKLQTNITTYVNSANFSVGLKSSFSGFKYSQYVYSDNWLINYGLIKFGTDGDSLSFAEKEIILKDYTKDVYDYEKLSFNASTSLNATLISSGDMQYLERGLSNYFFSNTFTSDSINWYYWDKFKTEDSKTSIKANSTSTFDKDSLAKYWKYLWQQKTKIQNSSSGLEYNNLYTIIATTKYLLENDGKNFIDYLNSIIPYGTEAYITWQNSQNTLLQESSQATVKDLLDASKISQNINNSYFSSYVGNSSSTISSGSSGTTGTQTNSGILLNNKGSLFNDESNYYKVVGSSLGFMGIQTSTSNSLSSVISSRLFTNQKENNSSGYGILYGYESKQKFSDYVKTLGSTSQVVSIANNLKSKIPSLNVSKIISNETKLSEKKELLSKLINDTNNIPESYFQERNGYIGNNNNTSSSTPGTTDVSTNVSPIPDVANGNDAIQYGAKVIQIGSKDLKGSNGTVFGLSNLITNISSKLDKINGVNNKTTDSPTNSSTEANEIVYNLLISAATNSSVQSMALNSILSTRKVNVNDIRLNNQLGADWVNNWIYKPSSN